MEQDPAGAAGGGGRGGGPLDAPAGGWCVPLSDIEWEHVSMAEPNPCHLCITVSSPGLGSIYSPMELPLPSAFQRETSREHVTLDGVSLSPDGYQAFMAIMNSWKVFGGRCVPWLGWGTADGGGRIESTA